MDLTIYTLTHKHFTKPDDNMYVPLQVGTAINSPLGYLRDDTGDNISALNGYYSELTGLYWIWKNVHDINYVGTCHYRRYLIDENEHIMNEKQYEQIFKEYELVTTKRVVLNNSYHYGFSANHNVTALDMTGEVIKELYPEYYDTFIQLVNGNETYFGNMIVTSKELLINMLSGCLRYSLRFRNALIWRLIRIHTTGVCLALYLNSYCLCG